MVEIIIAVVALAIGGGIGYAIFRYVLKGQYQEVMDKARKDAEVVKEKKLLEVKEKFLNKKSELEKEVQQRNQRIQQSENRLKQRELNLNQRQEEISRRRQDVEQQQQRLDNEKKMLQVRHQELDKMQEQEREKLEELSGLSAEEAKTRLVESMKDQARLDAASYVNEIVDEAKLNANQQAKKIVIQTIQRVATETAIENSVSVFHIENDEVKGRIMAARAATSAPWKLPAVSRSSSMTPPRPSSSRPSTPSAARSAAWPSTSSWPTVASIPPASRRWSPR